MSSLITMSELQGLQLSALEALYRQINHELAQSPPNSARRRNALANLENVGRAIHQRRFVPNPPGF